MTLATARHRLLSGEGPTRVLGLLAYPERAALERVAVPACRAVDDATLRWLETGADADGLAALEAARLPGAEVSLTDWLKTTSRAEVVQAVERAILRGTRERR